jgi:hypothetical protein
MSVIQFPSHRLLQESTLMKHNLTIGSTPSPQQIPVAQLIPTQQSASDTLKRQLSRSLELARMVSSKHKTVPQG